MLPVLLALLVALCPQSAALSHGPVDNGHRPLSRRDALVGAASTAAVAAGAVLPASAAPLEAETVDVAAFNAARAKGGASSGGGPSRSTPDIVGTGIAGTAERKVRRTVVPSFDPGPLLPLRGGYEGKATMPIPRVGYSLYKTPPEQAARCTALALRCGVRHLDVGTLYGSNAEVAKPLKLYLDNGLIGLNKGYYKNEKDELLMFLDAASSDGERHALRTFGLRSKSTGPPIDGTPGRRARRDGLFVSHKLSNDEQSTDVATVKKRVRDAIAELGVGYLDLVSIHSPLTDKDRRLATYRALLELRDAGFVRAIGVCNYGLAPLREITKEFGDKYEDLPSINQLELSPFNRHEDVIDYCDATGIAVGCAAWSKLSGDQGPVEEWKKLANLADLKGVTKAQLLVRWALQRGYVCVPRSATETRAQQVAIGENSYGGVNPPTPGGQGGAGVPPPSFALDEGDMAALDRLDVGYKAGRLGRRDGWGDDDVKGPGWDPTEVA